MSEENVETIRQVLNVLNRSGGFEPGFYEPDVEFTMRPDGPTGGEAFQGIEGLRRASQTILEAWEHAEGEILDIIDFGNKVIVDLRFKLRGRGSGVELEVDESWAYWFRNGRILRFMEFGTRQEALEATGLSE